MKNGTLARCHRCLLLDGSDRLFICMLEYELSSRLG